MKVRNIIFPAVCIAIISACGKTSFGERMERECRENTRKLCPIKVEEGTMLDSMTFNKSTHTLHYYYSLHGPLDLDTLYTEEVAKAHRQTLITDIRKSVTLREAKESGVHFSCTYLSASTGRVLLQYLIRSEEYTHASKK